MKFILAIFAIALSLNANALDYKMASSQEIINDISKEKDVRILFFFASWCSFCNKSFVELERISEKYKNDNLKIYAISVDENHLQLQNFLRRKKGNIAVYQLDSKSYFSDITNHFKVKYEGSIPHTVVLDLHNKKVADGNYNLAYFDSGLDKLLKTR